MPPMRCRRPGRAAASARCPARANRCGNRTPREVSSQPPTRAPLPDIALAREAALAAVRRAAPGVGALRSLAHLRQQLHARLRRPLESVRHCCNRRRRGRPRRRRWSTVEDVRVIVPQPSYAVAIFFQPARPGPQRGAFLHTRAPFGLDVHAMPPPTTRPLPESRGARAGAEAADVAQHRWSCPTARTAPSSARTRPRSADRCRRATTAASTGCG